MKTLADIMPRPVPLNRPQRTWWACEHGIVHGCKRCRRAATARAERLGRTMARAEGRER